jgi:hypothetical protein
VEVISNTLEASCRNLGCELPVERPKHLLGIEHVTCERNDLLSSVNPLVRPTGYKGLCSSGVGCKRILEVTLDGSNIRLLRVPVKTCPVVSKVETIRRH